MSDTPFELKGFEHVEAVPGKALLRVAAAPTFEPSASTLIIDGTERIRPLPAPPGPPGVARVAFSIPARLAEGVHRYALALALDGGETVDLPAPDRREAARTALAGAGLTGPAPAPAKPVDVSAANLITEFERRLRIERARREAADAAADTSAVARLASETRLRSLESELVDARGELDSLRGDLDSTRDALRSTQGEAELAHTQATHARAEAEAAESGLIQRAAEVQLLRQALSDRDTQAQETYLEWEQITAGLAAELEGSRQVMASFQQHAQDLQLELADCRLQLTSLQALSGAHLDAAALGAVAAGDTGDPGVVAAQLNAAAMALEHARSRASEAEHALSARESELDRLREQLPADSDAGGGDG